MSTAIVPDGLFSTFAVMRWMRGPHRTPASAREGAVYDQRGGFTPATCGDIEDAIADQIEAEQERVLLVVGTLLMRKGESDLWKQVYASVITTPVGPTEHLTFLAEATDKARRGEI